ncbi:translation initiation factor IF3 subunit 2 [Encephalitozoon intestinalis ATCC 50506]|uniref:Serine-threonine kinase receptor-associated protein n=1 Tax=Encephalitozoon intestinalis (strain ATCC 50506) TaxID=876142 RepID=E0S9F9_ENCIT|nr:translation initiation factor IF3 subunit 2 [Encephalitozoon intestinalis ATCC 50506]ADM12344.1 translation initiation factor IF3 subunit 2 [Encephalitozoon intestinalis ATCC 50506]UTX46174.1 translation initiation factor 3 subunit B [Encephalitozoon intestinalis]
MDDGLSIGSEGYFLNIKCHERPITDVKFNYDGDLIFTSGKDSIATLLRSDGSVVGEYKGHRGSIFSIAVDNKSTSLVTGSADQSIILWDVSTGKMKAQTDVGVVVKGLDFYKDGTLCLGCSDDSMGKTPSIGILDTRNKSFEKIFVPTSSPIKILMDISENFLVYCDSRGGVSSVDLRNSQVIKSAKIHTSKINNIRPSRCRTFFITGSMDSQAKIIDFLDLSVQKTFVCEEPVNCAAIFNTNDKVICVGGINARDVTTTKGKSSFDANFFDVVTCEKIGSYSTHFGTINSVDVHPSGKLYCSGGEEGTITILAFGQDFFQANFTNFN